MFMEPTFRWYGPNDPVRLDFIPQTGATGIVTSLHHIPYGELWTPEEILARKKMVEAAGMTWSVVESLPVHEQIKTGGPDVPKLLELYKQSLRNLGEQGIQVITYNFMPVLDWARTDLSHPNPNGTTNLFFSRAEFAYFDICILKRQGAEKDWQDVAAEVEKMKQTMTAEDNHKLVENIIVKTQGFVSGNIKEDDEHPVELFRQLLDLYKGITKEQLRENMKYFLNAIMPTCEEYDMYMCVHPDDPPFPILGLPRIVTSDEDIRWFLEAVDNPHNGLTFCAGSLSAGRHNDVVELARKYCSRTWFVHLRSCHVFDNGDFTEASHLGGRADLIELARIFEKEETRRSGNPNIGKLPMRVDHGMTMLGDENRGYNAGYSFLGRMFAMGQVQGIIATVDRELGKEYRQPGLW